MLKKKTVTDDRYPLCSKYGVLRKTNSKCVIVSTHALYQLLGNSLYQEACPFFQYTGRGGRGSRHTGPVAGPIEEFLSTYTEEVDE